MGGRRPCRLLAPSSLAIVLALVVPATLAMPVPASEGHGPILVQAQGEGPIRLVPGDAGPDPDQDAPPAVDPSPAGPDTPGPGGDITIEDLGDPLSSQPPQTEPEAPEVTSESPEAASPDTIATASDWDVLPDPLAGSLFDAMPDYQPSRTLADLQTALMSGPAPGGYGDAARIIHQMRTLTAIGAMPAASAVAEAVIAEDGAASVPEDATATLLQAGMDVLLLAGRHGMACNAANTHGEILDADVRDRMAVLCGATSNDPAALELTVEVARESGAADSLFLDLADLLLGFDTEPDAGDGVIDAVTVALARIADSPLEPVNAQDLPVEIAQALVTSPNNSPQYRIETALTLNDRNAITPAQLAQALDSLEVTEEEISDATGFIDAISAWEIDSLLYQASEGAGADPALDAAAGEDADPEDAPPASTPAREALAAGLTRIGNPSSPLATLYARRLADVTPRDDEPDPISAYLASAILYAQGETEAGETWYQSLRFQTTAGDDSRLTGLWAMRLAARDLAADPQSLGRWLDATPRDDGLIGLAILRGLNVPVPGEAWLELMDAATPRSDRMAVDTAFINRLLDAAGRERTFETAALAVIGLGDDALFTLDADPIGRMLLALRAGGHEEAARALGTEILARIAIEQEPQ